MSRIQNNFAKKNQRNNINPQSKSFNVILYLADRNTIKQKRVFNGYAKYLKKPKRLVAQQLSGRDN